MKKNNFIYALLGAIALAGAGGLSSCTSEDEVVDVNPGYNQETGEVPVQFVFNVATGNTPVTRMSEANVQALETNTFRGMDQTALMSFKLTGGKHVSTPQTADVLYALGPVLGAGAIGVTGEGANRQEKSHRVLELSVPAGTTTMMFWGKAAKSTNVAGADHAQGKISFNVNKDLSQTEFSLCPILIDDTQATDQLDYGKTAFNQYQLLISTVINNIISTSITDKAVTYTNTSTNVSTTKTVSMKWSDYAQYDNTEGAEKLVEKTKDPSNSDVALGELGKILSNAYVLFNNISKRELRAGSGYAVEKMLVDLYTVINKVATASSTSIEESIAQEVGKTIKDKITAVLNDSQTGWKQLSSVKRESGLNDSQVSLVKELSNEIVLEKFPGNFGMPDGAALLQCTITPSTTDAETIGEGAEAKTYKAVESVVFNYRVDVPTYDMGGDDNSPFVIANYMYPAELCYFGNSPIRATNDTHKTEEFPEGITEWNNEDSWKAGAIYGNNLPRNNTVDWTKNGVVLSSTRSVAMQENINYGTSLLKYTVRYGAAELNDNNSGLHPNEPDNKITVNSTSFQLKGICIGGQTQKVGWNYLQKDNSPFTTMIYDNALSDNNKTIPAYESTGAYSQPSYTLVWDNYQSSGSQSTVYVALEFVNNTGKDFWGQNNLIRNGATFYITGQLDPSPFTSSSIKWPGDRINPSSTTDLSTVAPYALPPYDSNGNTIQTPRVFIQDYMTTASFVIGASSLKKALVAVPDLREAQLSLGLSVDLNWSTGLNFADIMLGGTGN